MESLRTCFFPESSLTMSSCASIVKTSKIAVCSVQGNQYSFTLPVFFLSLLQPQPRLKHWSNHTANNSGINESEPSATGKQENKILIKFVLKGVLFQQNTIKQKTKYMWRYFHLKWHGFMDGSDGWSLYHLRLDWDIQWIPINLVICRLFIIGI